MEAFRTMAEYAFETEMVVHLAEFSPLLSKTAGEEQMRKTIRLGIAQASSHGLTNRGPVRLYLELMLLFGSHFDTDPQYPWATAILKNLSAGDQMQRAEILFQKTL